MSSKTLVRGFVMAFWSAAMFGGTAIADVILPTGLAPGSQYQLAFVTADTTVGTSGFEGYYNNFVTAEAAQSPTLASLGATWTAITSTYDGTNYCNAIDNAPTYPGVPIYNTLGQLVITGSAFYSNTYNGFINWSNPIDDNQHGNNDIPDGNIDNPDLVFTGSFSDGNASHVFDGDPIIFSEALGLPQSEEEGGVLVFASYDDGPSGDLTATQEYNYDSLPVYALSSPITVAAPEPGTFALLGSGAAWSRDSLSPAASGEDLTIVDAFDLDQKC